MRPIDLSPPKKGKVASSEPKAAASIDVVGLAVVGGVCAILVGAGLFFLWGQVTSLTEQTAATTAKSTELQGQSAQLTTQIQQAGVRKDYSGAADAAAQSVLTSLQGRVDHARVGREIRALMPSDMWFESLKVGGGAGSEQGGDLPVTITGVAKDLETLAAFKSRINVSPLMKNAEVTETAWEPDRGGKWLKFTLEATLSASANSSAPSGDAQLASAQSGEASGGGELALEPAPNFSERNKKKAAAKKKPAAKKPAAPVSAFEQLAQGDA